MRADTNGDGRVNGVDSTVIRDRLSSFVVDLAPVVSSAVPVATSIRGIDEGQQLFSNTPQQFELQRSSQDVERIMPTRIVGATRLIAEYDYALEARTVLTFLKFHCCRYDHCATLRIY